MGKVDKRRVARNTHAPRRCVHAARPSSRLPSCGSCPPSPARSTGSGRWRTTSAVGSCCTRWRRPAKNATATTRLMGVPAAAMHTMRTQAPTGTVTSTILSPTGMRAALAAATPLTRTRLRFRPKCIACQGYPSLVKAMLGTRPSRRCYCYCYCWLPRPETGCARNPRDRGPDCCTAEMLHRGGTQGTADRPASSHGMATVALSRTTVVNDGRGDHLR